MVRLQNITITQFKNYSFQRFNFNKNVIGICGLNGIGKTNLLDAIYYCCFTKSYFTSSDSMNIENGKDGFRIEALFDKEKSNHQLICVYKPQSKKEFSINDVLYEKLSKHIGQFTCVMIAPDDISIITGASEERRKYLDSILCQIDANYLQQLILYNKLLQQRNSLLKAMAQKQSNDFAVLEIINHQMNGPCNHIFEKRTAFTKQLLPLIVHHYNQIANNNEIISAQYQSKLAEHSFQDLLKQNLEKDLMLQRSNIGIHKDDLIFSLNGEPFKNIASQGQRKSLLFAMKLAAFELLKSHKGFAPILLLDDVFEKLDEERMHNLLKWVCIENDGQVFITDTHKSRLESSFKALHIDGEIIEISK